MTADDEDERELERMLRRAKKRGAELRKKGNVAVGAWRAHQKVEVCEARLHRIGRKALKGELKNPDELIEAADALVKAGAERHAYAYAMTYKERNEHHTAIMRDLDQKKKSDLPSV